jgi:DNA-binding XRE family transcriptional regulator
MNLKLKRIEKNIKQNDLAKRLGISQATLVRIEKGNSDNLKFGLMKQMAEMLEIPFTELFL